MIGCCTRCKGTGYDGDPSTNGLCWDCRATGCCHPEPLCETASSDSAPSAHKPEPSFEEVLEHPTYQAGFDHELLPHLVVERCRCAAVHVGPCTSGRVYSAGEPPTPEDMRRANPAIPDRIVIKGDCNVYWGSHGCSLTTGHVLPHVCADEPDDPCSEHTGQAVRYHHGDGEWSEWLPSETYTMSTDQSPPCQPLPKRPCGEVVADGCERYDPDCGACVALNSDAPEWTV